MRLPKPARRGPAPRKRIARRERPRARSRRQKAVADYHAGRRWAVAVKQRDGWECQLHGVSPRHDSAGWDVQAHHMWSVGAHPDMRLVLQNGITVCASAHRWADGHRREVWEWLQRTDPDRYAFLAALSRREGWAVAEARERGEAA